MERAETARRIFTREKQPVTPSEKGPAQEIYAHTGVVAAWRDARTVPGVALQVRQARRQVPEGGQFEGQTLGGFKEAGLSFLAIQALGRLLPVFSHCLRAHYCKALQITFRQCRNVHAKCSQEGFVAVPHVAPFCTA